MVLKFLILYSFLFASLFSNESAIKVVLNELNNNKLTVIKLINKHVLFIKPKGIFKITNLNKKFTVSIFYNNNSYPFKNNKNDVIVTAPNLSNAELQIYINTENSIYRSFSIITAFEDKNIHDGFVRFNKNKYVIGPYPKIPSKPGKVNYFKKEYTPPKWFLLWNTSLLNRPISKYLKYKDLVTVPKPLDKTSKRPTKIFTCCYKIMKEFDNLIDTSRENANFRTVRVLSFYRTPLYNKSLGTSAFSRHIYGDAIDFFIDENKPFMIMDDLNGDNKKTVSDAKPFFLAYKKLITDKSNPPGGMGIYFSKKGASIHYDSRGHLARWGAVDKWWPIKALPKDLKDLEDKIKLLQDKYNKLHQKKKKQK
ncbi:MAG: hypothetical protein COA79_00750 [Planctomycetota bacterium]|nr:MAG: hypothetical protein COA79_00750 [Planctomycetota bacterium]